jgi:ribosomal protein S14
MKYLQIKDKKLRLSFLKMEIKFKLKKFISINLLTSNFITNNKFFYLFLKKKKSILSKIVRRCVLTNRSKSIRSFKVSRIQSKELISFGVIPGYKKAVW